jgi:hypothetical protein
LHAQTIFALTPPDLRICSEQLDSGSRFFA